MRRSKGFPLSFVDFAAAILGRAAAPAGAATPEPELLPPQLLPHFEALRDSARNLVDQYEVMEHNGTCDMLINYARHRGIRFCDLKTRNEYHEIAGSLYMIDNLPPAIALAGPRHPVWVDAHVTLGHRAGALVTFLANPYDAYSQYAVCDDMRRWNSAAPDLRRINLPVIRAFNTVADFVYARRFDRVPSQAAASSMPRL